MFFSPAVKPRGSAVAGHHRESGQRRFSVAERDAVSRGSLPPISASPRTSTAWPPPKRPGRGRTRRGARGIASAGASGVAAAPRARATSRRARRVSSRQRGSSSAACGSRPRSTRCETNCRCPCGCMCPPITPNGPQQLAVAQQEARDDRVVRPLAGREPVGVSGLEREAVPAVVERDAGAGRARRATRTR